MRPYERALTMLRATPGVVTDDAMRWCGVPNPNRAIEYARTLGVTVRRVPGLGWRL